ncbi:MAG: hypothetical protein IJU76_05595 [Desulfovibrionaceae bacterium]|nr:hypothetical protein [Desulfovibrionaceae bacterium]
MNRAYIRTEGTDVSNQLETVHFDIYYHDVCTLEENCPKLRQLFNDVVMGDVIHIQNVRRIADNGKKLTCFLKKMRVKEVTVIFYDEGITLSGSIPKEEYAKQVAALRSKINKQCLVKKPREHNANGRAIFVTEEKKELVRKLIRENPERRMVDIAEETGVSRSYCYTIRNQMPEFQKSK